jgi:hypothetical protein
MTIIGALIGIIVLILIFGVVYWAIQQLLPLIPLPEPFRQIVNVLMVLILVFLVLYIVLLLLATVGVHVPIFHTELVGIERGA